MRVILLSVIDHSQTQKKKIQKHQKDNNELKHNKDGKY